MLVAIGAAVAVITYRRRYRNRSCNRKGNRVYRKTA